MNRRLASLLLIVPLLSAACAFGYHARGSLSDVPGELRGKAFPGNTAGGGRFVLADGEGRLRCDGEMAAPDSSPVPGSCDGQSGKGVVHCSDGRLMTAQWTAISCRAFQGTAEDERGNRLLFRVERKL